MQTQKITKTNLKEIYNSINENCNWRKQIIDIVSWSEGKTVEIPQNLIE